MSAADYHASVAAPAAEAPVAPVPTEPRPVRVPATSQPVTTPQPGVPASAKPTRTKTVVGPFPAPPPSQGPAAEDQTDTEGSSAEELDYEDEAPTMLHSINRAEEEAEAPAGDEVPIPARGETVVGPAPTGPAQAAAVSSANRATIEVDPPVAEAAKADRAPPHTPPSRGATTSAAGADSGPVSVPSPREQPSETDLEADEDFEVPRSSPVATALVAVLLLAVVGVVVASVVQKGTPDPRPLLEDLLRGM
jgi:hypothetical protein